jgi:hypothetical protein
MMLREAPAGREGWASASLSLSDVLGSAIGIGIGGAAVAAVPTAGLALADGITIAWAVAASAAIVALAVSRRLPTGSTAGAPLALLRQ